jgi:anaerobic selenocysteine-containing dehydrogenase
VRGIPEFAAEFPTVTLADEILTPGRGQVRAMILVAGNPVLSVPDGRRMDAALEDLEFCVSVDFYLNESNRHADVILPPQTTLERDEFDLVFPAVSVRNHVRWGERVIDPGPDTRSDAQILLELLWRIEAERSGVRAARMKHAVRTRLLPKGLVDLALRIGPYGVRRGKAALSVRTLRRHPHGIDLGPLTSTMPARLMTKGKRIRLDHPVVTADWPRVVAALAESATTPADGRDLLLIGRRHLRSNNSWMHNSSRLLGGSNRCTVLLHPIDAEQRGIHDGSSVTITSRVGSINALAQVSEGVMPGVVCMPHGWGHGRAGVGWTTAARTEGESVNDITDTDRYDPLSGNAAVTALPVRISAGA